MKKLLQKIKHHLGFTSNQENILENETIDVKNNIETTPSIELNSQKPFTLKTKETTSYGSPNQSIELGHDLNNKAKNHKDKTVISELIKNHDEIKQKLNEILLKIKLSNKEEVQTNDNEIREFTRSLINKNNKDIINKLNTSNLHKITKISSKENLKDINKLLKTNTIQTILYNILQHKLSKEHSYMQDSFSFNESTGLNDIHNSQYKDYTKYSFDGKAFYGKGPFVREFIKNYVNEHPNITFLELEKIFPPETHSRTLGVFRTLSQVNEMIATIRPDWKNRFFLKKNDIIILKDSTKIVVNSEWGRFNIENFLKIARKIKKISTINDTPPTARNIKTQEENYTTNNNQFITKYSFDNNYFLEKEIFVLEFIKNYVKEHPNITFRELEKIFPPETHNKPLLGVIHYFSYVKGMISTTRPEWKNYFFLKDTDIIALKDNTKVVVNNQWDNYNIENFITLANKIKRITTINDVIPQMQYTESLKEQDVINHSVVTNSLHNIDSIKTSSVSNYILHNTYHYKSNSQDYTKYSFDGKYFYGKGRFVLEFIRNYINEHPNITFLELEKIFPPETHSKSLGVIRTLSQVNEMIATIRPDWKNRFFLKENDIIILKDSTKIVVNSQWGKFNIENFLKIARKIKKIISK